jgi:HSP20 family protein
MFEEVEPTIERVERLYRTVTGKPAPMDDGVYAPIPPEKDPQKYVEQQLEKLLSTLEAQSGPAVQSLPRWTPAVAIFERADHLLVQIDLPGVKRDHVQVELLPGMIAISGQRRPPTDEEGRPLEAARVETPSGRFARFIPFTAAAGAQVVAQLANGVLEVKVPRTRTAAETRRIVTVQ